MSTLMLNVLNLDDNPIIKTNSTGSNISPELIQQINTNTKDIKELKDTLDTTIDDVEDLSIQLNELSDNVEDLVNNEIVWVDVK